MTDQVVQRERKYLVTQPAIVQGHIGTSISQGYFLDVPGGTTSRVRVTPETATLTTKGKRYKDTRIPLEDVISIDHGLAILNACGSLTVSKMRYTIIASDHIFKVDVFLGSNEGLTLAELQLKPGEQIGTLPAWCSQDVTEVERYYNANLALHPYSTWTQDHR